MAESKYILLIDDGAVVIEPGGVRNAGSREEIEALKERMGGHFPEITYRMYRLTEIKEKRWKLTPPR